MEMCISFNKRITILTLIFSLVASADLSAAGKWKRLVDSSKRKFNRIERKVRTKIKGKKKEEHPVTPNNFAELDRKLIDIKTPHLYPDCKLKREDYANITKMSSIGAQSAFHYAISAVQNPHRLQSAAFDGFLSNISEMIRYRQYEELDLIISLFTKSLIRGDAVPAATALIMTHQRIALPENYLVPFYRVDPAEYLFEAIINYADLHSIPLNCLLASPYMPDGDSSTEEVSSFIDHPSTKKYIHNSVKKSIRYVNKFPELTSYNHLLILVNHSLICIGKERLSQNYARLERSIVKSLHHQLRQLKTNNKQKVYGVHVLAEDYYHLSMAERDDYTHLYDHRSFMNYNLEALGFQDLDYHLKKLENE